MNYLANLQSIILYDDKVYISSQRQLSFVEKLSSYPLSRELHPFELDASYSRYIPMHRACSWVAYQLGLQFEHHSQMISALADYYDIPFADSCDDAYFVRIYLNELACYNEYCFTPLVPGVKLKAFYRYDSKL